MNINNKLSSPKIKQAFINAFLLEMKDTEFSNKPINKKVVEICLKRVLLYHIHVVKTRTHGHVSYFAYCNSTLACT